MKKLLVKITAILTATILSLGLFSGCDLVTTDVERDMNQVIAEVSIPNSGLKDTIYKRELASAFNTTGYYYVAYYGYGLSETYQMLLDDIIESRIIVQQSKLALTGKTTSGDVVLNEKGFFEEAEAVLEADRTTKDIVLTTPNYKGDKMTTLKKTDSLDLFLTEYEYTIAQYNLLSTVESLLASYRDDDEDEKEYKFENISVTDRTTLTLPAEEAKDEVELKTEKVTNSYAKKMNKINKDFDLGLTIFNEDGEIAYTNMYALDMDVYKAYIEKFDISTKENKRAVKKLIKNLQQYGFISSEEASQATPTKVEDLLKLTYFQDTVKSLYENIIVSKYKLALENQQEKLVNNLATLHEEYRTLFYSQKEVYDNNHQAYETALENAGKSTFVVYNPDYKQGSYGYIANLLLGFSEEQTQRLEEKSTQSNITDEDVLAFRQSLVNELMVKDLRESWVYSNHGTFNNGEFTFDSDYCKTESLRKFNGTILGAKPYTYLDENGEESTKYSYKSIKAGEVSYADFYNNIFANVMGIKNVTNSGKIEGVELENIVSKRINDETLEKFRDLIYAYSTDPGSLAENYGYVYSPITSSKVGPFDGKYVQEYAEASKRLIEGGVGSYEAVVTEFGVHVLLCTSVILPSGNEPIGLEEFKADAAIEGTLAYMFKEYKLNLISSTQINSITDSFITQNRDKGVTLYEDRYADLISDEETEDEHAGHNH